MNDMNVISRSQRIIVDPVSKVVTIVTTLTTILIR